jgi:two-component system sensor histidine kinase/response regulator
VLPVLRTVSLHDNRIEPGKVELKLEPVDCRMILEEVVSGARRLAAEKGIALQMRLPDDPVVVDTDRRSLTQILVNLTNNAIKFTHSGVVRVELDSRHGNGVPARTRVRVLDTGTGIKPEDQEKLFAPIQQGEASATRLPDGAGLGLYVSRQLAELIRADISFASEYGMGSVFIVDLTRVAHARERHLLE